jgi:hypothetical protein
MSLISRIVEGWKKLASYIYRWTYSLPYVYCYIDSNSSINAAYGPGINTYKNKQFYSIIKQALCTCDITQKIKKNSIFL